jgi:hypothetical protein
MKKLILLVAVLMIAGTTYGQVLQKGTLIGTHAMIVTLNTGVTMEQFIQFYSSKVLPEMNKIDPDWKVYLVKSIRGSINENSFGLIHVIKSDKVRSKYMNADGSFTEFGNSANQKMKPVMDELNKYGTYTTTWTDWVVN